MTGVVVPSRLLPNQGRSPGVKPTGNVTIDWSHPVAKDLLWYHPAFLPNGVWDGKAYDPDTAETALSGASFQPTEHGLANGFSNTSNTFAVYSDTHLVANINKQSFTAFADFSYKAIAGANWIFANADPYSGSFNWGFRIDAADEGYLLLEFRSTNVATTYAVLLTNNPPTNERYRAVVTYDGERMSAYLNGKHTGDNISTTGDVTTADYDIVFNSEWANSTLGFDMLSCGVINRALSEAEAISLSADPYQFLREPF